jgi:eukaryotic-like serine/threonine-protein kinase
MEPERWRQIDELLERALERSPEERPAFLDAACTGDRVLRSQVDTLLRAHQEAEHFLAVPALEVAARHLASGLTHSPAASALGHYDVIRRLGAGGMGVVYLARDTRLDRMVALKFLPLALDEEHKIRFVREAKATAALEHPNIGAIYEIKEASDGQMFIVMGYYDGETLAQRIQRGRLPLEDAVTIASQIAAGLVHAHSRGVVHRDVKPGNIMLTRDRTVKIIDFGLAKLQGSSKLTEPERTIGTVAYLSPEQARGDEVDERTDIWSLGAVLYEMLAGQVPFRADSTEGTIRSILMSGPEPLKQLRPDVPVEIQRIVNRALRKDLKSRYPTATELLNDLADYQASTSVTELRAAGRGLTARWMRQRRVAIPALLILIVLASVLGWSFHRQSKVRWARETLLPEISRLVDEDQYAAAFALAREAEQYIPTDPLLVKFWPVVSRLVSIRTTPQGAGVYMKDYDTVASDWTYLGTSPLDSVRIPPGLFRWRVEKSGFATVEGVASGWYRPISFVLDPVDSVPEGMVRVPGGRSPYSMIVSGFESVPPVQLQDFWMDRHEVSNRQFSRFVDDGGYHKREYWKHPFVRDGRVVSWEQAMTALRDTTGRPGPSTWEAGDYPPGHDDHPVAGVSWYEAAAYAEFSGKSLPTVYHWNRAAITGDAWISSYMLPFSNFGGRGAARLGSHDGVSRSGTYDMAGNVKEWCWNEAGQGKRYILGGGWNEPSYMFHEPDARPPFQRDASFGFRCVKELTPGPRARALAEPIVASVRNYSRERPVSDTVFRVYRGLYAYDKTPLNAAVKSTDASEPDWIRERVTFDAAYGGERMDAHLFVPRNAVPPYQTIVHFPGAESMFVRSSDALVEMSRIDFILKSGRAVLWPIYKGTYERPDDMRTYFPDTSVRYRDRVIHWAKDLARSIDYLETRSDIDRHKLAFYGYSWGACMGAILPAVEERLKASVLMGPGLYLQHARPEVDQIHFAPRVTIPTLIVDGRDDFVFPRETSQEPFYRFLGTPREHKRLVVFEGGHSVPRHHLIKESLDWLDRYLGPVQRRGHLP